MFATNFGISTQTPAPKNVCVLTPRPAPSSTPSAQQLCGATLAHVRVFAFSYGQFRWFCAIARSRIGTSVPHVLYSMCELDTAFLGLSDVDAYCATSATGATVCNMLAAVQPRMYAESVFVLLYLI